MLERIQLKRTAGWRLADHSDNAVIVDRRTKWGNPYFLDRWGDMRRWIGWYVGRDGEAVSRHFDTKTEADGYAVELFRDAVDRGWAGFPWPVDIRAELAGKDLACWCPLDQPCHADALLEIANSGGDPDAG